MGYNKQQAMNKNSSLSNLFPTISKKQKSGYNFITKGLGIAIRSDDDMQREIEKAKASL